MEALIEVFVHALIAIAQILIELFVLLVVQLLSSAYLLAHSKGISRAGYVLSALASLHLLIGIVLVFTGASDQVLLSPLYSRPALITSVVAMLIGIALPAAVRKVRHNQNDLPGDKLTAQHDEPRDEKQSAVKNAYLSATGAFVIIALIAFALTASVSASKKRRSITERLCATLDEKVNETWQQRASSTFRAIEKFTDTELSTKIPCMDKK